MSPFVRLITEDYVNAANNREDDLFTIGVGAGYSPNAFLNFSAQAYYSENDSNVGLDYDNTVFEFSASLRY